MIKKILYIILLLLVFNIGLANGNSFPSFYTHQKGIIEKIRDIVPQEQLTLPQAVEKVWDILKDYKYVNNDLNDVLQSVEETVQLKGGDCEDFTLYILWSLRVFGVELNKLGYYMFFCYKDDDNLNPVGHITPMFKYDSGWHVLEIGKNQRYSLPFEMYKTIVHFKARATGGNIVEFIVFGLEPNSGITICKNFDCKKYSFEMLKKVMEKAFK